MIRTEAIDQALPDPKEWLQWRSRPDRQFNGGRLASVSKGWRNDVEKRLFSRIRINPSKKRHVLTFREFFAHERRRLLSQLEITIDDRSTGPWHKDMGLLQISQVMEKVGHFLQYIKSWGDHRDGEQPRSIEIIFVSISATPDPYSRTRSLSTSVHTPSLWEEGFQLNTVTGSGRIPTNVALWAIKSEFPSVLDMVTHLTFPPDCVPLPAAQAMIQRMPKLKSCDFEIQFDASQLGWKNLTGKFRGSLDSRQTRSICQLNDRFRHFIAHAGAFSLLSSNLRLLCLSRNLHIDIEKVFGCLTRLQSKS